MFRKIQKNISIIILIAFITTSVKSPAYAQLTQQGIIPILPVPGMMVHLSPEFTPAHLQGLTIHPENALQLDFIIQRGDMPLTNDQKKVEYTKLIKYFLASLTIPEQDQWVNLSPYERNRIIKDDFGKTEMGRDLLAQDYLLKQITSSIIYPEEKLGSEFWNRVYERAYKEYGNTNIPVNTFNKVWIIPDEAAVYESGNTVYVLRDHLKVMLEEDYLSLSKHAGIVRVPSPKGKDVNKIGSQIVREIVLPALEKEVNEGKNFANLRQIYSGMILATWYKYALKESLLAKVYANKAKVKGVDQNPQNNEVIYKQYLQAFKKGVFNYIKEDVNKYTNETVPRKYFSGGAEAFLGVEINPNKFSPRELAYYKGKLPRSILTGTGISFNFLAMASDITKVNLNSFQYERTTPSQMRNEAMLGNFKAVFNKFSSWRPPNRSTTLRGNAPIFLALAKSISGETDDEIIFQFNRYRVGFPPKMNKKDELDEEPALLVLARALNKAITDKKEKARIIRESLDKFSEWIPKEKTKEIGKGIVSVLLVFALMMVITPTSNNDEIINNIKDIFEEFAYWRPGNREGRLGDVEGALLTLIWFYTNKTTLTNKDIGQRLDAFKKSFMEFANWLPIKRYVKLTDMEMVWLTAIWALSGKEINEIMDYIDGPLSSIFNSDNIENFPTLLGLAWAFGINKLEIDVMEEYENISHWSIPSNERAKLTLASIILRVIKKADQPSAAMLSNDVAKAFLTSFEGVVNGSPKNDRPTISEKFSQLTAKLNGGKKLFVWDGKNEKQRIVTEFDLSREFVHFGRMVVVVGEPTVWQKNGDNFEMTPLQMRNRAMMSLTFNKDAYHGAKLENPIGFPANHAMSITEIRNNIEQLSGVLKVGISIHDADSLWGRRVTITFDVRNPKEEQLQNEALELFGREFHPDLFLFGDPKSEIRSARIVLKTWTDFHYTTKPNEEVASFLKKYLDVLPPGTKLRIEYDPPGYTGLAHESKGITFNSFYMQSNGISALAIKGENKEEMYFVSWIKKISIDAMMNPSPLTGEDIKSKNKWTGDPAMQSPELANIVHSNNLIRGGIDFNTANLNLQIKRDGNGIPLPLAQQDMAQLSHIQGFEPEIIEIKPALNLPILSELRQKLLPSSV